MPGNLCKVSRFSGAGVNKRRCVTREINHILSFALFPASYYAYDLSVPSEREGKDKKRLHLYGLFNRFIFSTYRLISFYYILLVICHRKLVAKTLIHS